jgi:hypothetical protein
MAIILPEPFPNIRGITQNRQGDRIVALRDLTGPAEGFMWA